MQLKLSNRTIVSLLFGKYKLYDVLSHFKDIFFCNRGDFTEDLMSAIFTPYSEINKFGVMNINMLFQGFESHKVPEVTFKFALKKDYDLEHLSCVSNGVQGP